MEAATAVERSGAKARDPWCGLREADRAVVRAFAKRHGRAWKQALCRHWEQACGRMELGEAGAMMRARAALGPSGLYRLRPADLAGPVADPDPNDWATDQLARALVGFFRALRYVARDARVIPHAVRDFRGELYSGGCMWFRGLPPAVLQGLVAQGFAHRAQGQNNSPALGTLLEMARRWPDAVTFEGYVVSPARPDCRTSVDGVSLDLGALPESERAAARDRFWTVCLGPDERTDGADGVLRAWWD